MTDDDLGRPPTDPTDLSVDDLGAALREVVEFVDTAGWGQPPMLFALVPTAVLAASQPGLIDPEDDSALSPVAQEPLPASAHGAGAEIERVLATTTWPSAVAGAALIQEIVVLPPEADGTEDVAAAATHPDRRSARLIVGALRTGTTLGLLRLRPDDADGADGADDGNIELLTRHDLAADLRAALAHTFDESD
ncbi:PPA1309 family protein [Gordonia mangrovi]|uniref:PPA1309 family protein n=1 Tax=Gordonia mangrovi TaxID=2665643 RepID=UPI0021AC656F|nr:PPA1309 family protein [Gordonia mangrovi]UVF78716.1 PPA1309 family protein [Gordonia mangrovi]